MSDLAAWLLDRIAEDEAAARAADPGPWRESGDGNVYETGQRANNPVAVGPWGGDIGDSAAHIARWDPARVLAECDAKRRIVEDLHEPYASEALGNAPACWHDGSPYPCPTLRLMALPYADAPGYREEWRP